MVAVDDFSDEPNAFRMWKFDDDPLQGSLVYRAGDWGVEAPGHVSHANARPGVPPEEQYVCGAGASRTSAPRTNEIVCFKLDESRRALVVAPVMTDLDTPGRWDDYGRSPRGNLDVTGRYFIWTSNMGGDRLDAFIVKVPSDLLDAPAGDLSPPYVSVDAPTEGAIVTGTATVTVTAGDDVGVVGVQLHVDGTPVGSEVAIVPYNLVFDTTAISNGPHALSAVARDAVGHVTTSAPVAVTVVNPVVVEDVVWTDLASATVDGHSLTKTGGCDPCDDSGATSRQGILNGYGYVEFSAPEPGPAYYIGLSSRNIGTNLDGIDFAIGFGAGAEVIERGLYQTDTSLAAGDVFRIAVEFGEVKYYKNGVRFHTSTVPPTHPLFVDASLVSAGSTVTNVVIASENGWAPDLADPVVAITAPAEGELVSGTATVTAMATDDLGVAAVQFNVDGAPVGPELTSAPYTLVFDVTALPDGPHAVTAVARDASGRLSTSAAVSVIVIHPTVQIESGVSVPEGNAGTSSATFQVTLSQEAVGPVSVGFATVNGTATAGQDYVAASGTVTFEPGESEKTVTVLVSGDTTFEADEIFYVSLSAPSGATISSGQGQGTIVNDDGPLACPTSPVAAGATFSTTVGGGVTAKDWIASFAPGAPNQTWIGLFKYVPLPRPAALTMTAPAAAGTYQLRLLANDTFALIGSCTYQVVGASSLSIDDVTVAEGTTSATFHVTLSPVSAVSVSVAFATANGTATAGLDYAATSGTLNFAAGESVKTVTVLVNGDTTAEGDETFFVRLSGASGAGISDNEGRATILDAGGSEPLTCPTSPVAAGATFSTTVSGGVSAKDWIASYAPGAPNAPWIGQFKYVPLPRPASLTMTAPGAAGTYQLRLLANDAFVLIGSCTYQVAGSSLLSIDDVTVTEGTTSATFHVTLSPVSAGPVSVAFAHGERDGHGRAGLRDDFGHAELRRWGEREDGDRARERGHDGGRRRDVLRTPLRRLGSGDLR